MDINQLNTQLLDVREALAEQERLSRALERAERSLNEERASLDRMAADLRKEDEDVARLEGASLVGLFYAVMGSKEARLDEERREVLAAKLKYDNCRRRVDNLERDVTDLKARLYGPGAKSGDALRAQYDALLAEKERLLSVQTGESARRLADLSGGLANARAEERELREAIQAGEQAREGMDHVVEALESAANWGTWDLLGGGMLASAVKHDRLDEANQAVEAVQPLLQRFSRELADVNSVLPGMAVEVGGLERFADIFIDGLISDLLVQSKINDSLEAARSAARGVRDLLARLAHQREAAVRQVQNLENERKDLLERV